MDEITNAELARRLDSMRRDVHDDLTAIHRRLDSYVLREVYQAEQKGQETRMLVMERELAGLRTAIDAAEEKRAADRKSDDEKRTTERKAADDKRTADRRFMVAMVGLPVLALIVQILLAFRSPT
ncbi:hypothetical protein GA0074692_6782 [Micromonospora pallida]|uniref:Uncharacterized protein n=1 Tax=Micromonospora pallida TaxID=145854 RepID=A0A1C6TNH0_9ACTN|nr:hypothetical protein [Micromonospora pallida]SCL43142.1 hypothetical protein GA0074692_6731 [Micromonospora pallida]SCL43240.1 hypothetical protein GA0074692_6782 [Micromonospora pallida]